METTIITVPKDKATQLLALSVLSAAALNKLSDKVQNATQQRVRDIENKINTYSAFI